MLRLSGDLLDETTLRAWLGRLDLEREWALVTPN
jgi:hypothetical protein